MYHFYKYKYLSISIPQTCITLLIKVILIPLDGHKKDDSNVTFSFLILIKQKTDNLQRYTNCIVLKFLFLQSFFLQSVARCSEHCYPNDNVKSSTCYEPRCEKTGFRDFRPGPTQTGLCSHRRSPQI